MYVKLADGTIKEMPIDIQTAIKILTREGLERALEDKVLERKHFKPEFLEGKGE